MFGYVYIAVSFVCLAIIALLFPLASALNAFNEIRLRKKPAALTLATAVISLVTFAALVMLFSTLRETYNVFGAAALTFFLLSFPFWFAKIASQRLASVYPGIKAPARITLYSAAGVTAAAVAVVFVCGFIKNGGASVGLRFAAAFCNEMYVFIFMLFLLPVVVGMLHAAAAHRFGPVHVCLVVPPLVGAVTSIVSYIPGNNAMGLVSLVAAAYCAAVITVLSFRFVTANFGKCAKEKTPVETDVLK